MGLGSDRRSVRHFLEVPDELNHLNIEFVSFRENLDTGGPLGRAVIIIIGAIRSPSPVMSQGLGAGERGTKRQWPLVHPYLL
jgi:hypothetical protein